MTYKDPYKVLNVPANADEDTVKRAFRKLARQHHPDVNQGSAEAERKFKEINEAYQRITNPSSFRDAPSSRPSSSYTGNNGARAQQSTRNTGPNAQNIRDINAQIDRVRNLTDLYNRYARLVERKSDYIMQARTMYGQKHGVLQGIFRNVVMEDNRKEALKLVKTIATIDSALSLQFEVSVITKIAIMRPEILTSDTVKDKIKTTEQRLNSRIDALVNGLEVLRGENIPLRYRASRNPA